MADFFNYEGVEACMGTLDHKFSEFAEILKKANDYVNENIHVSHDSALYGNLGKKMLDSWNENASTFSDFYENFTAWSQLMSSIMASYGNFENQTVKNAIGQNQSSGATLKGVAETRAAIAYNTQLNDDLAALDKSLGKDYKVIEQGVVNKEQLSNGQVRYTYVDGSVVTYSMKNNEVNKMVVEKADGTIETKYKLSDGGSVVEKYDKNGKAVSSNIVDAKGNVVMERIYTGEHEPEKIVFYNSNGKVTDTMIVNEYYFNNNRGVKEMSTSDMYNIMSNGGTRKISTEDMARETAFAAMDNHMGGYYMHSMDDFKVYDKNQTISTQDEKYVQQRVQDRGNNTPQVYQQVDIAKYKEEQGYDGVAGSDVPSGYNGGTGYNPSGNNGNNQSNGNGGYNATVLPYNGQGGQPTTLQYNPNNQPQVVPLNNGTGGYNPGNNNGNNNNGNSGQVYYV